MRLGKVRHGVLNGGVVLLGKHKYRKYKEVRSIVSTVVRKTRPRKGPEKRVKALHVTRGQNKKAEG